MCDTLQYPASCSPYKKEIEERNRAGGGRERELHCSALNKVCRGTNHSAKGARCPAACNSAFTITYGLFQAHKRVAVIPQPRHSSSTLRSCECPALSKSYHRQLLPAARRLVVVPSSSFCGEVSRLMKFNFDRSHLQQLEGSTSKVRRFNVCPLADLYSMIPSTCTSTI